MADNQENILVEFDYNNISIIDPNKVIDENGRAKERNVKQENLVLYANLECKVLPRTKLILGASNSNEVQTISVASMNFLNPGQKTYLDNSYTDEVTGKETLKGKGINQRVYDRTPKDVKSDNFYIRQATKSNGSVGAIDNGLLGITSINIRQNTSFMPIITIKMEDIKGRALFESGDNSPYAAFFNLPYPLFYLTIKGYYGKAVKLPLVLQNFTSSYNSGTANFEITCTFYTYKYNVLSDVTMGMLVATPHMYRQSLTVVPSSGGPNTFQQVKNKPVELGYQKIKEMYNEYKSKGIIPDDFPEITVVQLRNRLELFIKNVLESYQQQNLNPITDISEYQETIAKYRGDVKTFQKISWFENFLDKERPIYLNNDVELYTYKQSNPTQREKAKSDLKSKISQYNTTLNDNKTLGSNGKYEVNGKKITSSNTINIGLNTFMNKFENINDIDINYKKTYEKRKNSKTGIYDENSYKKEIDKEILGGPEGTLDQNKVSIPKDFAYEYYDFGNFNKILDDLDKKAKEVRESFEIEVTKALAKKLENKDTGIGFVPNIRNVLAVFFANGEAFLRMMEDVHTSAWDVRNEKVRKKVIYNSDVLEASSEPSTSQDSETVPVFPWPQFLQYQPSDEKQPETYVLRYPGDPNVVRITQGDRYDIWPEVEFVEEFIKGLAMTIENSDDIGETENQLTGANRISLNAIEYPISNIIYDNKEEVKYFYEIYERLMLASYYTKFVRSNFFGGPKRVARSVGESEATNIIRSLGVTNAFLIQKLKDYKLDPQNFLKVLKHFSNQGVGESWQNFIRGIFNTSYIKNLTENSEFEIYDIDSSDVNLLGKNIDVKGIITQVMEQYIVPLLGMPVPLPSVSEPNQLNDYFTGSSKSIKTFDFTDLYPFTNQNWTKNNMSLPYQFSNNIPSVPLPILPQSNSNNIFKTGQIISYNPTSKFIANFTGETTEQNIFKPFSGFNYLKPYNIPVRNSPTLELNLSDLPVFYKERYEKPNSQFPTEGGLVYKNYSGNVSSIQTVSILNTPYFINSIQDGVKKFRNYDEYPYVASAYLFLNSLPLATLKERYKTYSVTKDQNGKGQDNITDLDYIFATLKKFGAIHKLPYAWVLKIGSVWHRYKKYIEKGEDILDTSWSGFSYISNYDPITNNPAKNYSLTLGNGNVDIVLEQNSSISGGTYSLMNTGFYPKLINDFNVFYQGYEVFPGYTNNDIQSGITSGVTLLNVDSSNITLKNGYDLTNLQRFLGVNPWSVYVKDFDGKSAYVMPSHGSFINQVKNECFVQDFKKVEVTGNTSVYNGSIRLFWAAPNYGYFDVNELIKPSPTEYMKKILPYSSQQTNFNLYGVNSNYSKIDEIFSVFEKSILDKFEEKFLKFSRSIYDYKDAPDNVADSIKSYGNFQMFFSDLMKIIVPSSTSAVTDSFIVGSIIQEQIIKFSSKIKGFMNYEVLIKYGNPSNFDKNLFYTFSDIKKDFESPYLWEKYSITTPNALPNSAGTITLTASKLNYPKEWKVLETYVGFSSVSGISYTQTGSSVIYDFFRDFNVAFNEINIKNFAPIIKIYATQKNINPTLTADQFRTLMTSYIDSNTGFINNALVNMFQKLRRELPNVNNNSEGLNISVSDNSQEKLEYWESFKAVNDKWISGNDFKTKTLFEDVLLLDRASRNIGELVIVDIFKLKNLIANINQKNSMLSMIQSILSTNNFQVMNIPSYVNFYNVQDAVKNPIPKPDGTLQMANDLFGTFLSVDTRNSTSKMVCFYSGKPSENLALKNSVDVRKNDAFDMRRASNNPLVEDQKNKKDWDKSNKVVGFNVDIGPQNQGIFQTFSVSQNSNTATAESTQLTYELARQGGNRPTGTQNQSLYNLYKNRSYTCSLSMLGNAMIQPTMYFNLRYVPMFNGPYLILSVNHDIRPGNFITTVDGIRQSVAALPYPTDYLGSIRTNLVQTIIKKQIQAKKEKTKDSKGNKIANKDKAIADSKNKKIKTPIQECTPIDKYIKYIKPSTPFKAKLPTFQEMKNKILELGNAGTPQLGPVIFSTFYLSCGTKVGFKADGFNYAGIDLNQNWYAAGDTYFKNEYYCATVANKTVLPYAVFKSFDDQINFMYARWTQRASLITDLNPSTIAKFIVENSTTQLTAKPDYSSFTDEDKKNYESKISEALKFWNSANPSPSPTPTPTPTPIPNPSSLVILNTSSPTPTNNNPQIINIQTSGGTFVIIQIVDPNFAINKIGPITFTDNANNTFTETPLSPSPSLIYQVNGQIPGQYGIQVSYSVFGLNNPPVTLSVIFNQ